MVDTPASTQPVSPAPEEARPAAHIAPHNDPRYGYRNIRYNANERESKLNQDRSNTGWGHSRVNSVLVCAIGNHWRNGAWPAVMDMVHYTNQYGYYCGFEEVMDRCFFPYDALGSMRNEAMMKGMGGYEWLLMVDNDIRPRPDDLVRLISRDRTIISPFVRERATGRALHGAPVTPYTGVQQVRWTVLSMLLFKTAVFNCTGPAPWSDAMGADEGYHFQLFAAYGHYPYIDTEVMLDIDKDPTYPLATLRMSNQEREAFWDKRRALLNEAPDRNPVNPNDPRQENGDYLPFKQNGAAPAPALVATTAITPPATNVVATPTRALALARARRMLTIGGTQ